MYSGPWSEYQRSCTANEEFYSSPITIRQPTSRSIMAVIQRPVQLQRSHQSTPARCPNYKSTRIWSMWWEWAPLWWESVEFCQTGQMASKTFPIPIQYQYTVPALITQALTSLQTNASNGIVVNMFNPKANRAILMNVLSDGKLFNILPIMLRYELRFEF